MPRHILALDLGAHSLKAALIESTLRGCRVAGLFCVPHRPDQPLEEQIRELCAMHQLHGDTVISCLPGDRVTSRVLSLPFSRPHQLQQIVPYELENQIPFTLEDVVIDARLLRQTTSGAMVVAVAVPRSVLTEHLETLAAAGLDPTMVGVAPLALPALYGLTGEGGKEDVAFLDIGERRTSVVLLRNGIFRGMRTLSVGLNRAGGWEVLARELHWTLLALGENDPQLPSRFFLCGGGAYLSQLQHELRRALEADVIPFQQLRLPQMLEPQRPEQGIFAVCLGLGLAEALRVTNPNVNLRRGEFAHQEQREGLRREFSRLGWLTAGVVVAAGVAFTLDMYRLHARYQVLRQEIRRVFSQTLPEVQTIVNERLQLQEAITTLQSRQQLVGGTRETAPLELLRQLSLALPEHVTLDLDEWTFDGEAVRLRGMTNSFDAVETIKTAANRLGLFREVQVKEVKSTAGNKKVSFGLQLFFTQGAQ